MNRRAFVTMLLGFAVLPWVRTAKALALPSVLSPALPAAAPVGPLLRCVPDWTAFVCDDGKYTINMIHEFSRPPSLEELESALGMTNEAPDNWPRHYLAALKVGQNVHYAEARNGLTFEEAQKFLGERSPYRLPWLMPGNIFRYVATPDAMPFPRWRDPNEPLPVESADDDDDDVDDWDSYWDHDEEHDPL